MDDEALRATPGEVQAVRHQRRAVDSALVRLGQPPLGAHAAFQPLGGPETMFFIEAYRLVQPGAAPLVLLLGAEFRVDFGCLTEWIHCAPTDVRIADDVADALTSSFLVRPGRLGGTVLEWTSTDGRRGKSTWHPRRSEWTVPTRFGPAFQISTT